MQTRSDEARDNAAFEGLALHHLYLAAASLLTAPDSSLYLGLAQGTLRADLRAAAGALPGAEDILQSGARLDAVWRSEELQDAGSLAERYQTVFGHALSPDYPPYETQYGEGQPFWQSQAMADIAGYYSAFGLQIAASAHERHDHLAVECEFAGYLSLKEAHACGRQEDDRARLCRDARRRFLHDHLGPAMRAFDKLFQEGAEDPLYRAAVSLAADVVGWDCMRLGLTKLDDRSLWRPVEIVPPAPEQTDEVNL